MNANDQMDIDWRTDQTTERLCREAEDAIAHVLERNHRIGKRSDTLNAASKVLSDIREQIVLAWN